MDDKFLYQLWEQPDAEYVNCLQRKLSRIHPQPNQWVITYFQKIVGSKRLVQIAIFLALGLVAVTAIAPARAFVSSLFAHIAGLSFELTDDYPGDNHPGNEEIIEPRVMTLGEALAIYPYIVKMPAGIPAGYVLNEDSVRVYVGDDAEPFANTIEFEWLSNDQVELTLRISDFDQSIVEIVAPDSIEEVLLDPDHSAVLIRGGWDADHKMWNNDTGVRLRWSVDNLTYELIGTDREQLIEVALSTLE